MFRFRFWHRESEARASGQAKFPIHAQLFVLQGKYLACFRLDQRAESEMNRKRQPVLAFAFSSPDKAKDKARTTNLLLYLFLFKNQCIVFFGAMRRA
ncbi:hypothetical protein [Laribacter hongkongensis]|uniref:hypothetical protein n=1 Tax=Laribacter hongkongensis TaxID=168471 RepID=UPI001EFD62F6|nr:hypothetical protein [Laribacter hongkongensis]MCG9040433.1 hypothetical protein [Laribacter hongkongensis]MCG9067087.1 hypothetical protein [Laribacter hongkongensis]